MRSAIFPSLLYIFFNEDSTYKSIILTWLFTGLFFFQLFIYTKHSFRSYFVSSKPTNHITVFGNKLTARKSPVIDWWMETNLNGTVSSRESIFHWDKFG